MDKGKLHDIILKIAQENLNISRLESRGMDALDFKSCHVRAIEKALYAAYEQGVADRKANKE